MRNHPLLCVLLTALALRLAAYGLFGGIIHADEVFQYTEPAHRLVFGQGLVAWEWRAGLRSWLFPGLLAGVMEAARLIGNGPVVQNWAVAAAMAVASLPSVGCAFAWGRQAAGMEGAWAAGLLVAAWPDALMAGVHPLIDAAGADALIPGLFLLSRGRVAGGVVLGLALVLRPQLAPVAGLAGMVCWRRFGMQRAALAGGLGWAVVVAGGALDWATFGAPFASLVRYVAINRAGAADYYGVEPWYHYLLALPFSAGLLILVLVPLGVWGGRLLPEVAAYAGALLLGFSLIRHKEFRFILGAYPLLLTLSGVGAARLAQRMRGGAALGWQAPALGAVCAVVALGNAPFTPAAKLWVRGTGMVAAEQAVSADPSACAVAVDPASDWYLTGGYTHLRPGIRLVGYAPGPGFDYALAGGGVDLRPDGFALVGCRRNMMAGEVLPQLCTWHRADKCAVVVPELALPDPPFLQAPGHAPLVRP